jgi:hypothetical protein
VQAGLERASERRDEDVDNDVLVGEGQAKFSGLSDSVRSETGVEHFTTVLVR